VFRHSWIVRNSWLPLSPPSTRAVPAVADPKGALQWDGTYTTSCTTGVWRIRLYRTLWLSRSPRVQWRLREWQLNLPMAHPIETCLTCVSLTRIQPGLRWNIGWFQRLRCTVSGRKRDNFSFISHAARCISLWIDSCRELKSHPSNSQKLYLILRSKPTHISAHHTVRLDWLAATVAIETISFVPTYSACLVISSRRIWSERAGS
jgi:hypothetical protein